MTRVILQRCAIVVAAALWAAAPMPVAAQQRASLAERVAALEAQNSRGGAEANLDLVNRVSELQSEVQALRGLVEEQQAEIAQLRERSRTQYLDLDGRLQRVESGAPASGGDAPAEFDPGADPAAADAAPAAPAAEPPAAPAAPSADDERAAYAAPYGALQNGEYAEAARLFRAFIEAYPDSEYLPNAYYWLGESYYVTQNYAYAKQAWQAQLERVPDSQKSAGALLKIGYCDIELGDIPSAERVLAEVIERYPGSTEANLAQSRLNGLRLDRHFND